MRSLVLSAVLLLSTVSLAADSAERTPGATSVLVGASTTVPFPEGIAVRGREVFVSGPATFINNPPPSEVRVYDVDSGALKRTFSIKGQNPDLPRALSCLTFDGQGRLYVIDTQQGVLRLDPETGAQEVYAPPLYALDPGTGAFPLPNDLAFDDKGWLYITDSFQGALWRIPPGGGSIQPWFRSPLLATGPFQLGPNGIRLHPNGRELWFTHTQSESLYALPLVKAPREADLRLVHRFAAGSGPDGLAFGASERVYVTLAGSNQLAVLGSYFGRMIELRVGGQEPWDAPANVAFTGDGSALVTNHAIFTANPEHFQVLDVAVYDVAGRMAVPRVP
jgi:sugar lactone lactonase YvrE